jgi:OmpA-OmpF porin, OOP family
MKNKIALTSLFIITLIFTQHLYSQIDIKGKIKDKVIQRADQHTDEAIDAGLDAAEEGVKDAASGDEEKQEESTSEENTENNKHQKENNTESSANSENNNSSKDSQPTLAAYSKYDFVPGEKVFFYDDFVNDEVGDFPGGWNTTGSGEVITTNLYPGKWFRMNENAYFNPEIEIPFAENYTVEFDFIMEFEPQNTMNESMDVKFIDYDQTLNISDLQFTRLFGFDIGPSSAYAYSHDNTNDFNFNSDVQTHNLYGEADRKLNSKVRVSIWVQKQRLRLYLNEKKVFDLPKLIPVNTNAKYLLIETSNGGNNKPAITNLRIAVGKPDLRNKLISEGKLVSYGVYFDSGKDIVKPESYGTLKQIADALKENPGVKIKIIGHTDSDGDDAKNMDLSKQRAAAVKNELVKSFGIDGSLVETDGKGETQPLAPNDTPSNKSLNRRVEFIKL